MAKTRQKPMTGDDLRELRDRRGLTQIELGAACGYSQSTISLHESGARPISRRAATVYRVALANVAAMRRAGR